MGAAFSTPTENGDQAAQAPSMPSPVFIACHMAMPDACKCDKDDDEFGEFADTVGVHTLSDFKDFKEVDLRKIMLRESTDTTVGSASQASASSRSTVATVMGQPASRRESDINDVILLFDGKDPNNPEALDAMYKDRGIPPVDWRIVAAMNGIQEQVLEMAEPELNAKIKGGHQAFLAKDLPIVELSPPRQSPRQCPITEWNQELFYGGTPQKEMRNGLGLPVLAKSQSDPFGTASKWSGSAFGNNLVRSPLTSRSPCHRRAQAVSYSRPCPESLEESHRCWEMGLEPQLQIKIAVDEAPPAAPPPEVDMPPEPSLPASSACLSYKPEQLRRPMSVQLIVVIGVQSVLLLACLVVILLMVFDRDWADARRQLLGKT